VLGSYSDSAGVEVVRQHVADYITQRDGGIATDCGNVFLSNGASTAINVSCILNAVYISVNQSHILHSVKHSFFQATVETVLLYGCEALTLTPTLERSLYGYYTHMLRAALNIKWWQHVPNSELYDNLLKVGYIVAARRMGLVRHCSRHPELPAGKVIILWEPTHGYRRRGRQ